MATITWAVEADFDLNDSFETDLTSYVERPANGIRLSRGMGRDGQMQVSQMTIGLANRTGIFTPEYASSSLFGKVRPGVPIRVTATHNSTSYTLWTGYIQRIVPRWQTGGVSIAECTCYDLAHYLVNSEPVNVTASTSRDTDGALDAIRTAMGLEAGDVSWADGVQDLAMHFVVGQPAMQAMLDVVASEMGGMLWVNASGQLVFEARNTRLGISADDTWGDGTAIFPHAVEYELDHDDYVTTVRARGTHFRSGQADTEIFRFSQNKDTKPTATSMALTAGQVYERTFQAASAYLTLTALETPGDYLANSAQNGSGTDMSANLDATVTDLGGGRFRLRLENTHASTTLYVTKFRLRAQPVEFFADRGEAEFTMSIPGLKAGRGLEFDVPFMADTGTALRDYAYQELRVGRYPFPKLTLHFHAGASASADDTTKKDALLALELGQQIYYKDTGLGTSSAYVDDWWYIESISYEIPPDFGGRSFNCSVTLIPSYLYRNLDRIAFDTFDRDNATGDLGTSFSGDTWAGDTGFNIVSNAARANTDTISMANLDLGASATDQVIEVSLAAVGTGDEVGVVFRYADADNQYRAYLDKGSNEVILEKNVATVVTELASPAFTVGTSHEMRVIVQGTRIRVWVDRVLYIDTTDSALSAGTKVGLFARNASGTTTFNDFYGQAL